MRRYQVLRDGVVIGMVRAAGVLDAMDEAGKRYGAGCSLRPVQS
jgi:hypothetical protein